MSGQDWIYPEVAEDDLAHPSLFQEYERGENNLIIARIHAEPVWLINSVGMRVRMPDIHYAERARQNDSTVMVSHVDNSIEFHVKDNGTCIYRKGIYRARLRMKSRSLELLNGSDAASSDATYSEETLTEQDNVIHQHECWPGVSVSHTISHGRIKEDIVLSACPDLGEGKWLRIAWDMKLDNLVSVLDADGSVSFLKPNGKQLFSFSSPTAWDADNKRVRCNYRITASGDLVLRVHAGDLATAQYPVTLDPTYSPAQTCTIQDDTNNSDFCRVGMKFTNLPQGILWSNISAATIDFTQTKTGSPTGTAGVYCSAGLNWTAGSLSDVEDMGDSTLLTATTTFDVSTENGNSSKTVLGADNTLGLKKVYSDASGNPPRCTVMMCIGGQQRLDQCSQISNVCKLSTHNSNAAYTTLTNQVLNMTYSGALLLNCMNYYRRRRQ